MMFPKKMAKNKALVAPAIGLSIILLVVGLIFWKFQNNSNNQTINSFKECANAGYPIMEIYPEQCRVPNGKTFTRQIFQSDWQDLTINEIGLTFKMPPGMTFRKEIADNAGVIRVFGFYIENFDQNNPYTLYGAYQADKQATEADLEKAKTEMDPNTIKNVTIDGYRGIEGLILGPKTRYITIILKDNKLFSVSTLPPTLENKALTETVLLTFNF